MKFGKTFDGMRHSRYYGSMSLTKDDLEAIKHLFDISFDERVPKIVRKIVDERGPKIVDEKISKAIYELRLDIGQFSLETTKRFDDLERKLTGQITSLDAKLSGKIDDLSEKLGETTEMADTNRMEVAKIKRKMGMT